MEVEERNQDGGADDEIGLDDPRIYMAIEGSGEMYRVTDDDIVIKGANSFDDVVANMDNLQTSMNKTYQALLKTNKQVAGEYGSVGRDMLQMLRQLRANPNDATTLRNFNSALKRMPTSDEIGDFCVFLASDNASAITGQCVNIDCGVLPQ